MRDFHQKRLIIYSGVVNILLTNQFHAHTPVINFEFIAKQG